MATLSLLAVLDKEREQFTLTNFNELKETLIKYADRYRNLVVTEEGIAQAKLDRATLNKRKKAINDTRLAIVREATKEFELQCKELCEIIDEASKSIDTQIKSFEEIEKEEKRKEIIKLFNSKPHSPSLTLEKIFNDKWLLKTYKLETVSEDMDREIELHELRAKDIHKVAFIVYGTPSEINSLSKFMLDNKIDFKQIDKNIITDIEKGK